MRYRFGAHLWNITGHFWSLVGLILKNKLAEEVTWASYNQPCHVHFASDPQGGFTSVPRKLPDEQRSRAHFNPTTYSSSYEMKMVAQEFCKWHKPKINKLKGMYLPQQI